ncbi:MAG: type II toxin-antitoxin system RelE/ParE family toxin [Candidatus Thiodiazotropha sp. (ex Dulcina madagascariensis)]|nr:type II toxin-antitoxin system RelE/ParE family toxin [Candidatus Thiodiazotropha sp. (ex Dulcina madagascariensis)]MCU7927117.1 type II toxin-antitoxin system RelE/ParE family toxin [Candidatus Thiodiazotropha sp. (ex Dulcina madagascariensis)]
MKVRQSGIFSRRIKKLHKEEKKSLDRAVRAIINDPSVGEMKRGDLAGVQIYKYKHNTQQYLLAYRFIEDDLLLTLLALGTHENFYRDLKR